MKRYSLIVVPRRKVLYALVMILIIVTVIMIYSAVQSHFYSVSLFNQLGWSELETIDTAAHEEESYLAIIIDDFGSGREGVQEMMSIGRPLTFAVMPFCEYTQKDAEAAHEKGYEVIVHLPMEPVKGKISWLGPHPILSGMSTDKVRGIVEESIDNVPYAVGANIHMGSKASSEKEIVSTIIEVVKEKKLYFVDSKTAAKPVAKMLAEEKGVFCLERDVFLDGQQPKSFVKKRLNEACEKAKEKGYAVAIGHVGIEGGKVTAEAIQEMLPVFDRNNVKLVFVSELNQQD